MSTCANGASVKAGVDPATRITLGRYLWDALAGGVPSWLNPFLNGLAASSISAAELAALNPDDPPVPSAATFGDALLGSLTAIDTVNHYLEDKLNYAAFVQYCVCNNVAPACTIRTLRSGPLNFAAGNNATQVKTILDPGTTSVSMTITNVHSGLNTHVDLFVGTEWADASHRVTSYEAGLNEGLSGTWTQTFSDTQFGRYVLLQLQCCGGGNPNGASCANWQVNITGCQSAPAPTPPPVIINPPQPPTLVVPPNWSCSTTSDLCSRLQQVQQQLGNLMSAFTIFQRHYGPFGYLVGPVHSSLTGAGTIPISDLIGVRVQLAATRPGQPVYPGNPPYMWNQGWCSINDINGMLAEKRITRTGMEWLPPEMPLATSFNYALDPGVVAVVTELEPIA